MMPHIDEEQISAYIDRQLNQAETRDLEKHLEGCSHCQRIFNEMSELTALFHKVEEPAPSPFLWSRIAADFDSYEKESRGRHRWSETLISGLRRYAWNPSLAAAVCCLFMIAGIAIFRETKINVADRAALAEIDKAYQSLAAQDPDSYNPFSSHASSDSDSNPFTSMRLRGRMAGGMQRH